MSNGKIRVYRVEIAGAEYLTRATGPAAAARFTLLSLGATSKLATQDDIIRLLGAGTKIIEAPVDPQGELDIDDAGKIVTPPDEGDLTSTDAVLGNYGLQRERAAA